MDHSRAIANLKGIESQLRSLAAVKRVAEERIARYKDGTWDKDFAKAKEAEIWEEFNGMQGVYVAKMRELSADLREAEAANATSAIDVNDTTLQNAINMVNAMGEALPYEEQKNIAMQFRGNVPAQRMLQAVYGKNKLGYEIKTTDFDAMSMELDRAIWNFASDTEKTAASFAGIERAANTILDNMNSAERISSGVEYDGFLAGALAGAGLI